MKTMHKFTCALILLAFLLAGWPVQSARAAATLTVNTTSVVYGSDGYCSLREAIIAANSDANQNECTGTGYGADTITFASSLGTATITLGSALPPINDAAGLTIYGDNRITISGGSSVGVFSVNSGVPLTLENITVTNGLSFDGGGVYNGGTLTITGSTFSGNSAADAGGGVYNLGTLTITGSTFYGNGAPYGGGLYTQSGTANISNSVFSGNTVTSSGGGIYNSSTLTITDSSFSGNNATHGGGIMNNFGTLTITNSTFSGNSSTTAGGIDNNSGTLTITNSTFSGNSANFNGGNISNNDTLNLYNTILANSTSGGDCHNNDTVTGKNNLIEDASFACGLTNGVNGNIIGSDPNLGALSGSPAYFPLNDGSPAIDAGDDATCASIDQRGVTRPQDGDYNGTAICDIGAYELLVSFTDVPASYWAWSYIERLYAAGITGGCGASPLIYCPDDNVTRAQMAVFLLRGVHGSLYAPPAVGASTGFDDVPLTHWAATWIKQLAAEGITSGCGVGLYCPEDNVTRAEMAVFLLRSEHGAGYTPPALGGSTGFDDVALIHWAAAWIKQLAAEAITGGCGTNLYCPEDPVTRAEMAVFLVRTFNLP